jgi:ribosomal protein L11 methyltransferase
LAEYPALDLTCRQDEGTADLLQLLYACLDDFEPIAIHDNESGDGWRVFFRSAASRDAASHALGTQFSGRLLALSSVDVPDDGWARRSQAQLPAVRVGRIVVTPPWASEATTEHGPQVADEGSGDLTVVIEPSMGFGTGHHETTRLCLQLLQRQPVEGCRVVDVGTGSGVLAIAAWKLGAQGVAAVDCDPDALQNALENVRRNGGDAAIRLVECDLARLMLPESRAPAFAKATAGRPGTERRRLDPADVVLANLTSSVLQRYAAELAALVRPGGRLIVSGFAPDALSDVERAFGRASTDTLSEGAWSGAVFVLTPPTRT